MRRNDPRRIWAFGAGAALLALVLLGAGPKKKPRVDTPSITIDETVSSLAYIGSRSEFKLEGVGLVSGLENTGVNPPDSWYRKKLLEEMQKAGVENANKLLSDPRFAMVLVKVSLPTGVTTSDRLDVTIELPPASGTTSLAGGYLMETRLREILVTGQKPQEGNALAIARGPVMIGSTKKPDDKKSGRVLGGARPLKDIAFNLVLKENRRSFKASYLAEKAVNQRFPLTDGVNQKGVAEAKSDQFLILKVPRVYHHNQGRFFEVVKRVPLIDTAELREGRQEKWGAELLDPKTAGIAALKLEALGTTAIETLKKGLASPNAQVRFFAGEALAYLNDSAGVEALGAAAVGQEEFRGVAFAALAALDQPGAHLKLRNLMDVPAVDVRYGAFNALRTLDEHDPFLGQVRVLDEPTPDPNEEPVEETLATAMARGTRSRGKSEDPFTLYLVDCEGPPMVHVASNRRSEIVVFGRGQKLLTPIVLGTGPILLNAADGDDSLQISKIVASRYGDADQKVAASLEIGDVVRQMAKLGANYPEVVAVLQGAYRQKNLPGPLVVDGVPGATPAYYDAVLRGKDLTKKDGALEKTNLSKTPKPRPSFWNRMFPKKTTPTPPQNSEELKQAYENDPVAVIRGKPPKPLKDDAVDTAKLDTPAPKRPSFFSRFRKHDQDVDKDKDKDAAKDKDKDKAATDTDTSTDSKKSTPSTL